MHRDVPKYTESIDAALMLVPLGDGFISRYHEVAGGGMKATCSILGSEGRPDTWEAEGATPAIATCIAALRARQAMEKVDG